MLWIGILTVVIIYLLALLCIKLVGPRGLVINDNVPDEVRSVFPTISRAMWWLFLAMNGDTDRLQPVLDYYPIGLVLLAAYMVFSSFAVLSVLTAVVCDRMAAVSEEHEKKAKAEEHDRILQIKRRKLEEYYDMADIDKSGSIDQDEFMCLLRDENLSDDLCDLISMEKQELPSLWRMLAKGERVIEQDGHRIEVESILRDDFIEGLISLHRAVKEFSILRLEKRMAVMERRMLRIAGVLTARRVSRVDTAASGHASLSSERSHYSRSPSGMERESDTSVVVRYAPALPNL
mmetsp:Transcript_75479/g.145920  ORF Transcript_75479/g.145920 Transcript_75479/m.145920 type:complete len:291 (-) Transcript_75479:23-895(-)